MYDDTKEYTGVFPPKTDLALVVVSEAQGSTKTKAKPITLRTGGHALTIGRSTKSDIVLRDRYVSSYHCRVEERTGSYLVRDLGSRNGTLLNGIRIDQGLLAPGARLEVGRATLLCVEGGGSPSHGYCVGPGGLVGDSRAMRKIFDDLTRFAPQNAPVLIVGETGTGKELAAKALHELSARHHGPFVSVNCGALCRELAPSAIFGHERGAFTGAVSKHRGAFAQANGGTLFLDEVGELDLQLQASLLRTLESRAVQPVGAEQEIEVDVRIVAATNRDMAAAVELRSFRLDLYHRLAVLRVKLPPLRQRRSDLPLLCRALLDRSGSHKQVSPRALEALGCHFFTGNVRELRNLLERGCVVSQGPLLTCQDLGIPGPSECDEPLPVCESESDLLEVVDKHGGTIAAAARSLGMPRTTLRDRLHRLRRERLAF